MQNINLNGKTIFVTGAAGFIGSNLVKRLLNDAENVKIIGIAFCKLCYKCSFSAAYFKIDFSAFGKNFVPFAFKSLGIFDLY